MNVGNAGLAQSESFAARPTSGSHMKRNRDFLRSFCHQHLVDPSRAEALVLHVESTSRDVDLYRPFPTVVKPRPIVRGVDPNGPIVPLIPNIRCWEFRTPEAATEFMRLLG